MKIEYLELTGAEIQSGHDRQEWAEGLLLQFLELKPDHEGVQSWLLNFGRKSYSRRLRHERNIQWNKRTQSAETCGG